MANQNDTRMLHTILAVEMVGYSWLMKADAAGTIAH